MGVRWTEVDIGQVVEKVGFVAVEVVVEKVMLHSIGQITVQGTATVQIWAVYETVKVAPITGIYFWNITAHQVVVLH